jgi:Divergent InlB B-repeat domain
VSRALAIAAAALAVAAQAPVAGAAVAPVRWCGTDRLAERQPDLSGGSQIHVAYVVPSDTPDRLGELASPLATDVASIDAWWRREDPAKAPRFDLFDFPGCDARFGRLDLGFARLAEPASSFFGLGGRFERISARLANPPFGFALPHKKYLVFYDGPVNVPEEGGRVCGIASGDPDRGGESSLAVIYLRAGCTEQIGGGGGNAVVTAHELVHLLGALPFGAPHACSDDDGHPCDSSQDLLWPFLTFTELDVALLDVGRDDYYGHSGSWFDVQDSRWLLNAPAQVPLSLSSDGAGSISIEPNDPICPSACVVEWDAGTQLTLTAQPASNALLLRWSGACTGRARICRVTMDAAKNVSASFRPAARVTVRLGGRGTVTSAPAGIACGRLCSAVFPQGQQVTLRARASRGWRFVRWTGPCRHARTVCTFAARGSLARATFRRRR